MLRAAVLRAEDRVLAGFGRFKPECRVAIGQHILLDPEGRHVEAVNHVGAGHAELHRLAGRHVQLVRGLDPVRIFELPVPLIAVYQDFVGIRGRRVHLDVHPEAPGKDDQHQDRRDHDPGQFDHLLLLHRLRHFVAPAAPIAHHEERHGADDADENNRAHQRPEVKQAVHFRCDRRSRFGQPGRILQQNHPVHRFCEPSLRFSRPSGASPAGDAAPVARTETG